MGKTYHDDPAWSDITPIPQDDTGHPLAAIAYTDEYSEAMSYLRAVMAKNEYSQRVLDLTDHIIGMNAAHYTVWLYRAKTIFELNSSLTDEIVWLNATALKNLKNYQIWHHRHIIIDKLGSSEGECAFIAQMLESDAKNYHVWSYRQWMVERFNLFDDEEEMRWTEGMIEQDVRNNSAWNHRFYLVFGGGKGKRVVGEGVVDREIAYAKTAIRKAPQNQSPWNFLRGVLRRAQLTTSTIKEFAQEFTDLEKPNEVSSSHALDALADIYAEEKNNEEAKKALDLLADRYDPIRARYWNHRKMALETAEAAA